MKKVALLLTALLVAQASFAYIEEFTTSDNKTFQGTGYSQETLKIIDTSRMLKQGAEKDYVPYYSTRMYSPNPIIKWYEMAKRYIDPAQDEHMFGIREINYNHTWMDLSPSYMESKTPNDRYNRLKDRDLKRLENAGKIIKGSNGIEPDGEAEYDDGLIIENL